MKNIKLVLITICIGLMVGFACIFTTYSVSAETCSKSNICSLIESLTTKVVGVEKSVSDNTNDLVSMDKALSETDSIKNDIKNALTSKGVSVGDEDFSEYPKIISDNLELGVKLTYDANGGTDGYVPQPVLAKKNSTVEVSTNIGHLDTHDYGFTNWNTKADGTGNSYDVETTIKLEKDTVLYAQYKNQKK